MSTPCHLHISDYASGPCLLMAMQRARAIHDHKTSQAMQHLLSGVLLRLCLHAAFPFYPPQGKPVQVRLTAVCMQLDDEEHIRPLLPPLPGPSSVEAQRRAERRRLRRHQRLPSEVLQVPSMQGSSHTNGRDVTRHLQQTIYRLDKRECLGD